jgi:hypothetical protein
VDHRTAIGFLLLLCSTTRLDAWLADVAQAGCPKAEFLKISFMMQSLLSPDKVQTCKVCFHANNPVADFAVVGNVQRLA